MRSSRRKPFGSSFDGELFSFQNLWRRYRECRRNKRATANALRFEMDAEANLLDLERELRCRWYLRYVDDVVLIDRDPEKLAQWREEIE